PHLPESAAPRQGRPTMLTISDLSVRIGKRNLLAGIELSVRPGELLALLGPNGAGKSTLFRAIAGELTPADGTITLDGQTLARLNPLEQARRRAIVYQHSGLGFPFSVAEVVAMGRFPHRGLSSQASDRDIVAAALEWVGIAHL